MNVHFLGVLFALMGMVAWGFGDFFIQKDSRSFGIWETLFFISIVGCLGLLPFVWHDFQFLTHHFHALFVLSVAGIAMMVSGIFVFEALKEGKLVAMEPIMSTELPIAALLSVAIWHENPSLLGWLLIATIFIGTVLAITEHHSHLHYHKRIFEKGVIYAAAAAFSLGVTDLLMGIASQETTPLLTVWFVWTFGGIVCFFYLLARGRAKKLWTDFMDHPLPILAVGIFDTLGWTGFCLAAVRIPISITTAITESYIIITLFLGFFLSQEKLRWHQKLGVAFVTLSVIALAATVG